MNKEKVKSWLKEHKGELLGYVVIGSSMMCIYGLGVRKGRMLERLKGCKALRKLGEYTYITDGCGYTVKDLGKVGMDSITIADGIPKGINEDSVVNTVMYFYDIKN